MVLALVGLGANGCEVSINRECGNGPLGNDPMNCAWCGDVCGDGATCIERRCLVVACEPGTIVDCYHGQDGTHGVGPCHGGSRTCDATGTWSPCTGEVIPVGEVCGDSIDNNCNGMADEDVDADGDGYTTCQGDCCDSTECSNPASVNPGAFDAPFDLIDNECNGLVDDTILLCDQGLTSNTTDPMNFAKAIDICQIATMADREWGVISAQFTLTDGTGVAAAASHAIRPSFGMGVLPKGGLNLAILSTGGAAAIGDIDPPFRDFSGTDGNGQESAFPPDFFAANQNTLPNAPGCPPQLSDVAFDPVMLALTVRVPTNAHSFKLAINFFSSEFPEWTCSEFNDFFVVLLDSAYAGSQPNPTDKNIAFYQPPGTTTRFPVGVNLATGNTGLFTQCVNGTTGCTSTTPSTISTCVGIDQLVNTGFDKPESACGNSVLGLQGGGTGWLIASGNVMPGEIMKLRIALWNAGDQSLQSLAVVDGFQWSTDVVQPGTIIYRELR